MIRRGLISLLFGLAALGPSFAAIAARPFIDGSTLDLVRHLPPAPADDSIQTRSELGELLAIPAMRTPQMVANANADEVQDVGRVTSALPADLQARFNAASLMAIVLADRLPEYRAAIFQRAAYYAENRVIDGVHDRSDTLAGRTTGALIALDLQRNPAFTDESRAAREVLRRTLGL